MIPLWRRRGSASQPALAVPRPAPANAAVSPTGADQIWTRARSLASGNLVWLVSFTALGTAEVAMLSARPGRLLQVLRAIGLGGAAGLVLTSTRDLKRSSGLAAGLDAANDLAWGAQGLAALSLPASARAQGLALGLGIVGGTIQTVVGLLRIGRGLRARDGVDVKLGLLDVGGGLLWLGWDLVGLQQPLYVGTYVVLMIGREAYANRAQLRQVSRALAGSARRLKGELGELLAEVGTDLLQLGRPRVIPF